MCPRREFLGPQAIFARLDADKDGLLSATEAAASKNEAWRSPVG